MKIYTIVILLMLTATLSSASVAKVEVLRLPDISDWQSKVFSGITSYQQVRIDDRLALHATSDASASGLVREIEIDLNKTPYMNWSWKVDAILNNVDEKYKHGHP